MELEVHRQERIMAPLQLVWEEMDSLEQILAKSPQIVVYDIGPGGGRARGSSNLAWGPLKWKVEIEAHITELVPRQRLVFTLHGPSLEVHYEGTLAVLAVGDSATNLDYRGHLDVRHRMAGRMRGLFNEIAEDQAHSLVHRVKVKAEQRRLAQERLLK